MRPAAPLPSCCTRRARGRLPQRVWCASSALALFLVLLAAAPASQAEEPWSVEPAHPVLDAGSEACSGTACQLAASSDALPPATSPLTLMVEAAIWGYQHLISPVDGATCGFHPTCSAYGMQAVHRHGWLLGSVMALERIIRNHRAEGIYPLVRVHGTVRLLDPLDANDRWFFEGADR